MLVYWTTREAHCSQAIVQLGGQCHASSGLVPCGLHGSGELRRPPDRELSGARVSRRQLRAKSHWSVSASVGSLVLVATPCCSRHVGRLEQLSPGKARLEGPPEAYSELLLARTTAARKREIATTMKQRWEVLLKLEQRFRVHPSLSRDHAASSWKDSGLRPVARPAASRGDG